MTFLISTAGAQSLTDRFFDEYYFPVQSDGGDFRWNP